MTERILLHAGIADSRMYRQQVQTLAPARALDLPGFGSTPLEPGSLDDRAFVRDALPDEPVTLIGTSLGGRIALELALEAPDRVAALVLVGPGLPDHAWSAEVRAFGAEEEEALERGDLDAAVEANVRLWLADDVDPEVRALVAEMQRNAFVLQQGHDYKDVPLSRPPPSASPTYRRRRSSSRETRTFATSTRSRASSWPGFPAPSAQRSRVRGTSPASSARTSSTGSS